MPEAWGKSISGRGNGHAEGPEGGRRSSVAEDQKDKSQSRSGGRTG